MKNARILTVLAVVVLLAAMVGQIVHAIKGESLTWDEGDHIFAGYESWKAHDHSLNPEHPPMVKMQLGDVEAAAGDKVASKAAYERAAGQIETMEPDAREQWRTTVKDKMTKL